jgi:hypothetical protein
MFSSRKHDEPASYPEVPASLRSDSVELSGLRKGVAPRPDTAPSVTPYLSLRSRLSQIWINRWTILLLLVLVRLMLLVASLNDNIGDAKDRALVACTKVEDIGSAMASMPHYLSLGVNDMAATGIEKAVSAMVTTLDLMLTGVQGIIIFFINFVIATYTCLLTALIHGTLDVVADVTGDVTELVNDVVGKATEKLDSIAGNIEEGLTGVIADIEDSLIGNFIPDLPKIDFSGPIDDLKSFELNSDDFVKDVRKLNDDLPTFEEVQNMTKEAIAFPFNLVKEKLNETYGAYKFDREVFPLAQKSKLTFCSDNDTINGFFAGLYEMVKKARIAFIVVLVVLAVAVMVPMAWLEIQRWRRERKHSRLIAENQYDPMDVVYIASRPHTSSWGIKIASRFSGKRQVLVRWCVAYATTPAALFVLSLAIAGFFSCLCQFILLKAVRDQVPALTEKVGEFADGVVSTLNGVSDDWAEGANGVIGGLSDEINNDVLGYVTNATTAINDTLTTFLDTMNDGLETVFKGTILLAPIQTVLHCVIGIKVENVQDGLTWVHDNAKVSLPLFAKDTFSLGAKESVEGDSDLNTFLASPSSVSTDEVSGAVQRVVNWLHNNIIKEALISTGILLVYVIVVLIGVTRALVGMAMPDRGRAEGGTRYTGEERPPLTPRSAQANNDTFPRFGSDARDGSSERVGDELRDEKYESGWYGARAQQVPGHARQSSYGHITKS